MKNCQNLKGVMNKQINTWKVYTHTTPNGDVYVGVTKNPKERWKAKNYKHNRLFAEAIDKFGWENIKHKVVFEFDSKEEALEKEDELIQYYGEKGVLINKQRSGLVSVKDKDTYMRQWEKDHRQERNERSNQRMKDKYANDTEFRERVKEKTHQWYIDHKEEHNAYMRQWRAKKKAEKMKQVS